LLKQSQKKGYVYLLQETEKRELKKSYFMIQCSEKEELITKMELFIVQQGLPTRKEEKITSFSFVNSKEQVVTILSNHSSLMTTLSQKRNKVSFQKAEDSQKEVMKINFEYHSSIIVKKNQI